MKKELKIRFKPNRPASALIMTIVLTVLLAIVAVMFLTVARMDRASTSNIADNKTLDSAAKSIVAIINKELINDTPGIDPNQEYYDYPDPCNPWLASIEPYLSGIDTAYVPPYKVYRWRQISNVNNFLSGFDVNDVRVDPEYGPGVGGNQEVIKEYPDIKLNTDETLKEQVADADGDGIADSKWFELENLRSSKGQRIYAAVRLIDHGGMINVNTAHSFEAATADGNSQMQINLEDLLKGTDKISELHEARCGTEPNNWPDYKEKVIWDYNTVPDGNYLPFDISDELELRYRYCIDSKFVSRIEANTPALRVIPETMDAYGAPGGLYDGGGDWGLGDWQHRITEPDYSIKADRRHFLTTVNYDRIIDPAGGKMVNINKESDPNKLYTAVRSGLLAANSGFSDVNEISAQIAVNIIDYRDDDPNITVLRVDDANYYGFERPCVYISELAYKRNDDPCDANTSYAIELFKPYSEDIEPNDSWSVDISGTATNLNNQWVGSGSSFYVMKWENSEVLLDINSEPNLIQYVSDDPKIFSGGDTISLTRDVNGISLVVDSITLPSVWPPDSNGSHCLRRDMAKHKCIMRLWDLTDNTAVTLGANNFYNHPNTNVIQAHPADANFTNIGEIGMVFRKPAYYKLVGDSNTGKIGYSAANKLESGVRLDLSEPDYQHIFQYLTVIDPCNYGHPESETRIKGRININTAPAFVIAQLPWVSRDSGEPNLAQAIVAYRDKMQITGGPDYSGTNGRYSETDITDVSEKPGFRSIGELMNIINTSGYDDYDIRYYARDFSSGVPVDQQGFPDLTTTTPATGDGAANDFEERDLIFARISDLVTVRSDVFTAYILVRVGVDGPQKRYIAILDRTGVYKDKDGVIHDDIKIIAFQAVPEAR